MEVNGFDARDGVLEGEERDVGKGRRFLGSWKVRCARDSPGVYPPKGMRVGICVPTVVMVLWMGSAEGVCWGL